MNIEIAPGYGESLYYARGHFTKATFLKEVAALEDGPSLDAKQMRRLSRYVVRGFLRFRPALKSEGHDWSRLVEPCKKGRGAFKATYVDI